MLFRQMHYFVTVVDCNSFTEAAAQCYISQSAISQQIQALEHELGVQLLIRENRHFRLTESGRYFYAQCQALLTRVDQVIHETKRLASSQFHDLRIGYLRCYSGVELSQAIALFAKSNPDVNIHIVNGTHEELYDLLRFGGVDIVLNDQRRAFSDQYINFELMQCGCYAELSINHPCAGQANVSLADLNETPCILIASKEQQNNEQDYYQNTLGFGGSYLFADSLAEGRLLVMGNRGFLPIESVGTLPAVEAGMVRLPLFQEGHQIKRNYCAFWRKDTTNQYVVSFAKLLHQLMHNDNH